MSRVLKRPTLAAHVADLLPQDLRVGKWREFLPSESFLCEQFQISHKTLRSAIAMLRREGLVATSQGSRTRIASPSPKEQPTRSNVIAWLSLWHWHEFGGCEMFFVSGLRRYLHDVGFELQVHTMPQLRRAPPRPLAEFVRDTNAACWILSSTSGSCIGRRTGR